MNRIEPISELIESFDPCAEADGYSRLVERVDKLLATSEKGEKALLLSILKSHGVVLFYDHPRQKKILNLVNRIKEERSMLLYNNEAYQLGMAVERSAKIPGAIAEVGVYQGASAKLICELKGNRSLFLFDTFEGLPQVSELDPSFEKGQFAEGVDIVSSYLSEYKGVNIIKGMFPESAQGLDERFSLVHLDVDLYESTKSSLEFFYPRMNPGGIILSHDYIAEQGVTEAVDSFFSDKPEPVIEMPGRQCLIVRGQI